MPVEPLKGKDKVATRLLEGVADILEREGIRYWIGDGTLLGMYRDNGFIPEDTDIDISILGSYNDIDLDGLMAGKPFLAHSHKGVECQRAYDIDTIVIDFYFYEETEENYISWFSGNREIKYPKFEWTEIEFRGRKYPTLDPEPYLTFLYGDWKKPVKDGKPSWV